MTVGLILIICRSPKSGRSVAGLSRGSAPKSKNGVTVSVLIMPSGAVAELPSVNAKAIHCAGWSVVKEPSGKRKTEKVSPGWTVTIRVLTSGLVKVQFVLPGAAGQNCDEMLTALPRYVAELNVTPAGVINSNAG